MFNLKLRSYSLLDELQVSQLSQLEVRTKQPVEVLFCQPFYHLFHCF